MTDPTWDPIISDIIPIKNGITAPPNTPVIINPEISFALSGRHWIAFENIIGKTLAMVKPNNPSNPNTRYFSDANINAIKAITATTIFS